MLMQAEPDGHSCKLLRFLDGDTADVEASLIWIGTHITFQERVRVDGINSPEIHSTNPAEKTAGLAAKAHAETLCPPGTVVKIRSANPTEEREKFGRWRAIITLPDGRDFGATMIKDGFAKEYHGEKR